MPSSDLMLKHAKCLVAPRFVVEDRRGAWVPGGKKHKKNRASPRKTWGWIKRKKNTMSAGEDFLVGEHYFLAGEINHLDEKKCMPYQGRANPRIITPPPSCGIQSQTLEWCRGRPLKDVPEATLLGWWFFKGFFQSRFLVNNELESQKLTRSTACASCYALLRLKNSLNFHFHEFCLWACLVA